MKTRVFFITILAPFFIYLLASQAALTTWNLDREYCKNINNLEIAVILEKKAAASVDTISKHVSKITGREVRVSSPKQQLEDFKSKFQVDVMSVLSENPFGPAIFSSLDVDANPVSIKSSLASINGVRTVAYPDSKREEIDVAYRDRHFKMVVLDAILILVLIFQTWLAVRMEGVANENVISASRAPYVIKRNTFHRRSFIRGMVTGVLSAVVFLALRIALDMNHEVSFDVNIEQCIIIAAVVVVVSSLLTYITQLFAFPLANRKS